MAPEEIAGDSEVRPSNDEPDQDFVPGPLDEEDAEAFEGDSAADDEAQDRDDEDPLAPFKPPFFDPQ